MIVETAVWVDHINGRLTDQVLHLRGRLPSDEVQTGDLIVMEVVRGAPTDAIARRLETLLRKSTSEVHSMVGPGIALQAAEYYRFLRTRGITVRSTIDCLIATFCIAGGHELLHSDRDFDGFERHLGLRVVHV